MKEPMSHGVRRISDELCVKHHLSVIRTEKSEQVARPYVQWLAEQNGAPMENAHPAGSQCGGFQLPSTWKQFLRTLWRAEGLCLSV